MANPTISANEQFVAIYDLEAATIITASMELAMKMKKNVNNKNVSSEDAYKILESTFPSFVGVLMEGTTVIGGIYPQCISGNLEEAKIYSIHTKDGAVAINKDSEWFPIPLETFLASGARDGTKLEQIAPASIIPLLQEHLNIWQTKVAHLRKKTNSTFLGL